MTQWVEIDGSPNYRKGPGSTRTLTRMFHTEFGQGLAQAAAHAFVLDSTVVYDGNTLLLTQLNPYNDNGRDLVQIVWEGSSGSDGSSPLRDDSYNDGIRRYHGEEEWTFAGGMDNEIITDRTGDLKNGSTSWREGSGYALGDTLMVPTLNLIWKKWFRKGAASLPGDLTTPHTVPRTKADALSAAATYLASEVGAYEPGLNPPKLGKILGASALERKFLCVDIDVNADGNLVCRTATFKYTRDPAGWLCPPYSNG